MRYSNSILAWDIFTTCKMLFAAVRMGTFLPCANASSRSVDRDILTDLIKCKVVPLPMRCLYAYAAPRPIQSDTHQGITHCHDSTSPSHQPNTPVPSPQIQQSPDPSESQEHLQAPNAKDAPVHSTYPGFTSCKAPIIALSSHDRSTDEAPAYYMGDQNEAAISYSSLDATRPSIPQATGIPTHSDAAGHLDGADGKVAPKEPGQVYKSPKVAEASDATRHLITSGETGKESRDYYIYAKRGGRQ